MRFRRDRRGKTNIYRNFHLLYYYWNFGHTPFKTLKEVNPWRGRFSTINKAYFS